MFVEGGGGYGGLAAAGRNKTESCREEQPSYYKAINAVQDVIFSAFAARRIFTVNINSAPSAASFRMNHLRTQAKEASSRGPRWPLPAQFRFPDMTGELRLPAAPTRNEVFASRQIAPSLLIHRKRLEAEHLSGKTMAAEGRHWTRESEFIE